jgi:hypothetical protein
MQQRQLRLGDVLDDYCPRERRVTNHAVVAMVGDDVRLTRCTTCDAEHEYKHARVPRQRRKAETPAALYAQAVAGGPKRVVHDAPAPPIEESDAAPTPDASAPIGAIASADPDVDMEAGDDRDEGEGADDRGEHEGPVHRPLIRATLPRLEGQVPPTRPGPDFTIRQPAGSGRANRFRPRHARGGYPPFGGSTNGNGPLRTGSRQPSGRSPQMPRPKRRGGAGRKRSK